MDRCLIERINNGFIFREVNEELEGKIIVFEDGPITVRTVYNTTEFEEKIVPLQKLFYTIMDYFGVFNNKNERTALDISIVDREDFPIEDTIKSLKEENEILMKENESLKCENIILTEKLRAEHQIYIKSLKPLDMKEDLKMDIGSKKVGE